MLYFAKFLLNPVSGIKQNFKPSSVIESYKYILKVQIFSIFIFIEKIFFAKICCIRNLFVHIQDKCT